MVSKVRIKKGIKIFSTGKNRQKISGRSHVVSVHYVDRSVVVTPSDALSDRIYRRILEDRGIDLKSLERLRDEDPKAYYRNAMIEIYPAKVTWAGTGGYWHWCYLSDVEVVE